MIDEIEEYLAREIVVEDPCPHGIPIDLCPVWCADDPAAIATVRPGRAVGAGLAYDCELAGAAPQRLTDDQLLDVAVAAERLERWVSALRTRMLGAFAARYPAGTAAAPPGADPAAVSPVSRWLPDVIASAMQVSLEEARGVVAEALRFTHVLPATLAEWEAGRIDERTADAIALSTAVLADEDARAVEAKILPAAAGATRRQVRDRLRRTIAKVDPDGAARRRERAARDRRLSINRGEDGMGSLWFCAPAEQVEASWRSVDRLARSLGAEDPRTLEQRRVDIACELLQGTLSITDLSGVQTAVDSVLAAAASGAATSGAAAPGAAASGSAGDEAGGVAEDGTPYAPSVSAEVLAEAVARALAQKPDPNEVIGRKPLIHVVVSLDTLLGGDRPAELVGHGPIPALTARALALGGVWERLVTDPVSGILLDHGRTTYRPPDALADYVRSRDGICRGPGCTRPIRDLDHHLPWDHGGRTSDDNLHGYCVHHHKLKDAPGWAVLAHPDGTLSWVDPCGRTRTTRPFDYREFTDPFGAPEPAADAVGPDAADSDATLSGTAPCEVSRSDGARPSDAAGSGAAVRGVDAVDVPPF